MSVLNDPGVQKVWIDGDLVFDRAQGGDLSALGFRMHDKGAEECGQGSADLCTGFGNG